MCMRGSAYYTHACVLVCLLRAYMCMHVSAQYARACLACVLATRLHVHVCRCLLRACLCYARAFVTRVPAYLRACFACAPGL
jgi:hypothetical protein